MTEKITQMAGSEIAVIGMAGKFPGAENIAEFWENLKNGIESLSFISNDELKNLDVNTDWLNNPNYVKAKGGVLEDKELFDASFFGYVPKEAEIMDPQIRIFHECAWSALEDAGYDPGIYNGFIGLYAGAGVSFYWESLTVLSGKCQNLGYFASGHFNNKDYLSTLVAYKLNLKGPCFVVQTACSTSLVAIHLACQGILYGECNMALAGGIRISPEKNIGYIYQEGMVASPDGHCRAFDAKAKGTIGGEGGGVVLLKSLEDAISDGDHIYAVIKGTAINNDGIRKVGYTAPSIEGQAEVIQMAQQVAEVEPESISYVETHGTGTELGDPVEIEALKLAFNTAKKKFCAVGSVKTNIGHLDAAAGVAGFIKVALALKYRLIPPSLHFETPNPRIDFENSPFYVNNRLKEWNAVKDHPLRACVSSFGIGGTNAHVVLEEWPLDPYLQTVTKTGETKTGDGQYRLILLSGKTPATLDRITENLCMHLKTSRNIPLSDVAYTLAMGRRDFQCRRMIVCKDIDQAIEALSNPEPAGVHTFLPAQEENPIIFMFPGLGAQYENMAREIYLEEPVFRDEMNLCFDILKSLVDYDIKEILYPEGKTESQRKRILDFEVAQLVVFIIEYALARLLIKWGIKPDAMIGYDFGEYAAACLRGTISLEDSLKSILAIGPLPGKPLATTHFADGIKEVIKKENAIFIEIGPGRNLSLLLENFVNLPGHRVLDMIRPADQEISDTYYLLNKIGQLWLYGRTIDWKQFYSQQTGRRLSLPTYPFERQRYWFDENVMKNGVEKMGGNRQEKEVAPILKARPQLVNPYVPPGNQVEENIMREWQRLFGYDRVGIDDNFFDLGGSSLMAVNLASMMERSGFHIVLADILSNPTIKKLATIINERKLSLELEQEIYERRLLSQLECIEKLNKGHNKKNIFFIHNMHGMVNQYNELAALLGKKYNVYGIQARGLKAGSKMSENPEQMIDDYLEQILAVQKDGCYIIGGYCNGLYIGYEIVRKLEILNHPVEKLIFFDPHAVFSNRFIRVLQTLEYLPGFFKKIPTFINDIKFKKAIRLNKTGKINSSEKIGAVDLTKKNFEDNMRLLSLHLLPLNIIKSPILAIIAEAWPYPRLTERHCSKMTKGNVTFVNIPGDHDSIFGKPYVDKLAEIIITM